MQTDDRLPLVNQDVLHELEDDFDDPGPARSFARDFVAFWGERYSRLASAIAHRDEPESLDALLSMRVASTMVGASRLAKLATELETKLKKGNMEAVTEALPDIEKCGAATIKELTVSYINTNW